MRPFTVVGWAVSRNASQSGLLDPAEVGEARVRPPVAAVERIGRLVRVRVEAEAVHQRQRAAARAVPGPERGEEPHRRRGDVARRGGLVVAPRREPEADDADRRVDGLERVVAGGEERARPRGRDVRAGRRRTAGA